MQEVVLNLHMHTPYSDGFYTHKEIAQAALRVGLDAVMVTDHNVFVKGPQGYYESGGKKVLLMVGEEIHDQIRDPQKNHMLVLGVEHELAPLAYDSQLLIDTVTREKGLAFLAHIIDPAAPAVKERDISWIDWHVQGYTGIELWNGFSEFKSRIKSKFHAIFYAFNPALIAHGPHPEALKRWDALLNEGRLIVAIGGSDAHALPRRMGLLRRTLFPYEFHFRGINNHVLCSKELQGEYVIDRQIILDALFQGRCFIGYDLPANTRCFRFTASGENGLTCMGGTANIKNGVTFQINLPLVTECHLIKDGQLIKTWYRRKICTYIANEPGVYRVEVYLQYRGKRRGWIFSNPIFIKR